MNPLHTPASKAFPGLSTRLSPLGALTALAMALTWGQAHAQSHHHGNAHGSSAAQAGTAAAAAAVDSQELAEGEVRRWDARTGKLTLRHGEIKSIGMPPMTMVFALQDPSQGQALKVGDVVRFRVADLHGALTITHIEAAR